MPKQPREEFDNIATGTAKNKYLADYYEGNVQMHGICNCPCKTCTSQVCLGKVGNCPQEFLLGHLPMEHPWSQCAQPW